MTFYPYQGGQPPYLQPGYYSQPMPDQLTQLRQQPMQQQTIPQAVQNGFVDDRIWVMGQGAATSYLVAANGFVRLWDSTAPVFYEKQADAQGKPLPLRIFEYTERTAASSSMPQAQPQQVEYVTVDDFNTLADRLTALENKSCKCKTPKMENKTKEGSVDE